MTFTENPAEGDTTPFTAPPSGRGPTPLETEEAGPAGGTAPADAPPLDDFTESGASPEPLDDFTESGASPEPLDDFTESGASPEPKDDGTDPGASPEQLDDFTESGASPEPDGEFNEPPPVPEVIDPNADPDGVLVSRGVDESGSQTLLLDRDGDGLFESRVQGVDLGDGTFKVVSEPELLDEPFSPSDFGDAPAEGDVGDGPAAVQIGENEEIPRGDGLDAVDQLRPDGETPPDPIRDAPPGAGGAVDVPPLPGAAPPGGAAPEPPAGVHAQPGDVELDLPELYADSPPYATGSDGTGLATPPAAGDDSDPSTVAADDPGVVVPEAPAADYEPGTDDDQPIEVNATADDGDDAGLLERVADAVRDTWDDATDAVT